MQPSLQGIDVPVKPKGNIRWTVLIFLLLGGVINYLDRANLSIAAPEMIKQLHLDNTDIGLMGTVFSWTYAVMQLPAGWLIDRFGAKKIYSVAVLWWSVSTFFTGSCSKMGTFLTWRTLLGIGEAPCFPTSAKLTASWFPRKERSLATGIWDSSSKWGPALAPPILVSVMLAYGWRALFYLTGVIGVIFILFFMFFYRNPDKSRKLTPSEMAYIQSDGGGTEENIQTSPISWGSLFKHRTMWGMILGFFCTIWIWNIFLNFLPLYLLKAHHVKLASLGIYASIPWLGGIVGDIFLGGYLSKKLVDKGLTNALVAKRSLITIYAILAGIACVIIPYVQSLALTLTLMTLALAFISAITGSAWAIPGDVCPQSMVASVGAIQNFGGYFGGAFSPVVAGIIADSTGSYTLAFVSGGIIAALTAVFYWFMVRKPIAA
ncbi:MFS transporter [Alicyclobacillus tolerans]|uniref:MFS transporter n=1 Tax=Alicyclobacillus tolerans TaxID=90970 RepID=UPI001F1D48C9|nr:MFS transporter [Alicyclobacillus tolerans]MCF8566798.1 MFS transporter [Alicyclobacillus tolerans]